LGYIIAILSVLTVLGCRLAQGKFLRFLASQLKIHYPEKYYEITNGREIDFSENNYMLSFNDLVAFRIIDNLVTTGEFKDKNEVYLFSPKLYRALFYLEILIIFGFIIYFITSLVIDLTQ